MTYQNLGYWIGQANDNSTGRHPVNWATGQRWSETSTEWLAMYDSEYAKARDTSVGPHPTGWTSGQLYSETADEWMAMYNAKVSELAAMTADRDTWANRANQAWGDTRQWNNGPSFESQKPIDVTYEYGHWNPLTGTGPTGNPLPLTRNGVNGLTNAGILTYSNNTFTVAHAGYFFAHARVDRQDAWGGGDISVYFGGSQVKSTFGGADTYGQAARGPEFLGAGTVIKFGGQVYGYSGPDRAWYIGFCPTPTYPR